MSRIPAHAKKVFEGKIFEVWQWEQRLYDGSTKTFEMLRRADSVIVIAATPEGRIVVTEQSQPNWERPLHSLPGGIVDPGETPLQAAKRELKEETGYVSDEWVPWREFIPMGKVERTMHVFIARAARAEGNPTPDAGERIDTKLCDLDGLIDSSFRDDFRHMEIRVDLIRAKYEPEARRRLAETIFGSV